jgi:hypothetical protein
MAVALIGFGPIIPARASELPATWERDDAPRAVSPGGGAEARNWQLRAFERT